MRILFIHRNVLGRPGAASTEYYPAILSQIGHDVTVVGKTGGNSQFLSDARVQVVEVRDTESWWAALRTSARIFKPDIVHTFIHLGCGLYPFVLKSASLPKFVVDIRSPLLRTGPTRLLMQLKNRLEILPYHAVVAHAIESAYTVIGRQNRIEWVPPGVQLDAIPHKRLAISDSPPFKIVYVGAIDAKRNLNVLVSATLMAAQSIPIRLDIYGQDQANLAALIAETDQNNVIRLRGLVPREHLLSQMNEYDVGLSYVPSRLYDAAPPLKTMEFLASGLPTLATQTKGNQMFIRHGQNGWLVAEDAESIASGIVVLLANRSLREHIATNARASVAKYDWSQVVQNHLIPVYNRLLSEHKHN